MLDELILLLAGGFGTIRRRNGTPSDVPLQPAASAITRGHGHRTVSKPSRVRTSIPSKTGRAFRRNLGPPEYAGFGHAGRFSGMQSRPDSLTVMARLSKSADAVQESHISARLLDSLSHGGSTRPSRRLAAAERIRVMSSVGTPRLKPSSSPGM